MHHTKLGIWVQPGGHCDGDSDVLSVAIKEAREESGIHNIEPISTEIFDIDVHFIPENTREKAHYHYDIRFLLQVKSNEEIMKNEESQAIQWFSKNKDLLPSDSRSITRMFDKWIKRA
jgi:8-oxo-dGTP pyrophosphatase MutT (NUDIX family)